MDVPDNLVETGDDVNADQPEPMMIGLLVDKKISLQTTEWV